MSWLLFGKSKSHPSRSSRSSSKNETTSGIANGETSKTSSANSSPTRKQSIGNGDYSSFSSADFERIDNWKSNGEIGNQAKEEGEGMESGIGKRNREEEVGIGVDIGVGSVTLSTSSSSSSSAVSSTTTTAASTPTASQAANIESRLPSSDIPGSISSLVPPSSSRSISPFSTVDSMTLSHVSDPHSTSLPLSDPSLIVPSESTSSPSPITDGSSATQTICSPPNSEMSSTSPAKPNLSPNTVENSSTPAKSPSPPSQSQSQSQSETPSTSTSLVRSAPPSRSLIISNPSSTHSSSSSSIPSYSSYIEQLKQNLALRNAIKSNNKDNKIKKGTTGDEKLDEYKEMIDLMQIEITQLKIKLENFASHLRTFTSSADELTSFLESILQSYTFSFSSPHPSLSTLYSYINSHSSLSTSYVYLFETHFADEVLKSLDHWLDESNQFLREMIRTNEARIKMMECKEKIDQMFEKKCEAMNEENQREENKINQMNIKKKNKNKNKMNSVAVWKEDDEFELKLKKSDLEALCTNFVGRKEGLQTHFHLVCTNRIRAIASSIQQLWSNQYVLFYPPILTLEKRGEAIGMGMSTPFTPTATTTKQVSILSPERGRIGAGGIIPTSGNGIGSRTPSENFTSSAHGLTIAPPMSPDQHFHMTSSSSIPSLPTPTGSSSNFVFPRTFVNPLVSPLTRLRQRTSAFRTTSGYSPKTFLYHSDEALMENEIQHHNSSGADFSSGWSREKSGPFSGGGGIIGTNGGAVGGGSGGLGRRGSWLSSYLSPGLFSGNNSVGLKPDEFAVLEACKQLQSEIDKRAKTEEENERLRQQVAVLKIQPGAEEMRKEIEELQVKLREREKAVEQENEKEEQKDQSINLTNSNDAPHDSLSESIPDAPPLESIENQIPIAPPLFDSSSIPTAPPGPPLAPSVSPSVALQRSKAALIREKELEEAQKYNLPILPPVDPPEEIQVKRFHWNSIQTSEIKGTIWEQIICGGGKGNEVGQNKNSNRNHSNGTTVDDTSFDSLSSFIGPLTSPSPPSSPSSSSSSSSSSQPHPHVSCWRWELDSNFLSTFSQRRVGVKKKNNKNVNENCSGEGREKNEGGAELLDSTLKSKECRSFRRIEIIDAKRAYNVSISLSHLRLPFPLLRDSILRMDDSVINSEITDVLLDILPTQEEINLIRDIPNLIGENNKNIIEYEELGLVEQFFYCMMTGGLELSMRLKCFSFQFSFPQICSALEDAFLLLSSTFHSILYASPYFHTFLGLILRIGNQMNGANSLQQVYGFHLIDNLCKIKAVKSADNKINLLQYIVQYVQRNDKKIQKKKTKYKDQFLSQDENESREQKSKGKKDKNEEEPKKVDDVEEEEDDSNQINHDFGRNLLLELNNCRAVSRIESAFLIAEVKSLQQQLKMLTQLIETEKKEMEKIKKEKEEEEQKQRRGNRRSKWWTGRCSRNGRRVE